MSAGARVASFGALLVAVFALAVLAGRALDPATEAAGSADHAAPAGGAGGHGAAPAGAHGLRLAAQSPTTLLPGRGGRLTFRILDARGETLREFETEQARRMHLIVVRRDLEGFQHLHPTMKPDGTWTVGLDFAKGGTYRVFADFTREGEQRALGADVQVSGRFQPRPLPAPQRMVRSDGGLEVALGSNAARPGKDGRIEFEVRDQGRVVTDRLQPYLGAKGHLVALREGDLAYLHTHAESDELAFTVNYPSAGAYRLFVQFRYEGRVRTAAFTQEITE